jgi:hypothetical protein
LKYTYETYLEAENPEMSDRDHADLFLNSVSTAVYGQLKADIYNDTIKGNERPGNLIYHFAS